MGTLKHSCRMQECSRKVICQPDLVGINPGHKQGSYTANNFKWLIILINSCICPLITSAVHLRMCPHNVFNWKKSYWHGDIQKPDQGIKNRIHSAIWNTTPLHGLVHWDVETSNLDFYWIWPILLSDWHMLASPSWTLEQGGHWEGKDLSLDTNLQYSLGPETGSWTSGLSMRPLAESYLLHLEGSAVSFWSVRRKACSIGAWHHLRVCDAQPSPC